MFFGDVGEIVANNFVDATANAVAIDGVAEDFFRDNDGKTGGATVIGSEDEREFGRTNSLSLLVDMTDATTGMEAISMI